MLTSSITTPAKQVRPRIVTIAGVLTAINTFRLIAILFILAAIAGTVPATSFIPGIGDFLTGLTAPFIVFALFRRKGVNTWATALVWHTVALVDVVVALALSFLASNSVLSPSLVLLLPFTFLTAHIISLVLLTRRTTKEYYIGSPNK